MDDLDKQSAKLGAWSLGVALFSWGNKGNWICFAVAVILAALAIRKGGRLGYSLGVVGVGLALFPLV